MAITFLSGSFTVGSAAEMSLTTGASVAAPATSASVGVFQFFIDLGTMSGSDQYQIKLYEQVYSSASQRVIDEWIATGPQSEQLWTMPPQLLGVGWDVTVKKLGGTDRTIYWSIRGIA